MDNLENEDWSKRYHLDREENVEVELHCSCGEISKFLTGIEPVIFAGHCGSCGKLITYSTELSNGSSNKFGEIARALGYLTPQQITRVLQVQIVLLKPSRKG